MGIDCDKRASEILHDCGARTAEQRDLLLPLARQGAALEADIGGRAAHDADYLRLLSGYESALQALRRASGRR